jgi:HlyD family secretion protein
MFPFAFLFQAVARARCAQPGWNCDIGTLNLKDDPVHKKLAFRPHFINYDNSLRLWGLSKEPNLRSLRCYPESSFAATVVVATGMLTFGVGAGLAAGLNPGQLDRMTVTVVPASQHCFGDEIRLSGFLTPSDEILVRPETEGFRISEILIEKGQEVRNGEVLAKLVRADDPKMSTPAINMTSPAAGIINFKAAAVGALATARGEPLFRITVGGKLDAEVDAPASMFQRIAPGQKARISSSGEEVDGLVREKSYSIDPVTQLGRIRVSMTSSPRSKLPAGVLARVLVYAGESCGMTVPLSAILYGPGGAFLQVVNDNKVETRRVRVGFISGHSAEIREGVAEDEIVVAKAGAFLRDGDTIKPLHSDGYAGRTVRK